MKTSVNYRNKFSIGFLFCADIVVVLTFCEMKVFGSVCLQSIKMKCCSPPESQTVSLGFKLFIHYIKCLVLSEDRAHT